MAPHADDTFAPSITQYTDSLLSSVRTRTSTFVSTSISDYRGYDHVHWFVGNAKQAVTYYIFCMGFHKVGYRDLSTGSRSIDSYAVLNGSITFVHTSPLPSEVQVEEPAGKQLLEEIAAHLEKHDDAVTDVAFEGDNVDEVYNEAAKNRGKSVSPPETIQDSCGSVQTATIQTFGEKKHTLISRKNYSVVFLPEYKAAKEQWAL